MDKLEAATKEMRTENVWLKSCLNCKIRKECPRHCGKVVHGCDHWEYGDSTVDAVEVVRKPVRGYEEQYVVDGFGRVYGVDRTTTVLDNGRIYEKPIAGKQMKQSLQTKGYKTVTLTKDGKTKTVYVHRIVAEAFIENPENLPMVNHKDEDKTNNFVGNLEWCTASYNRTYGKGAEKQARQLRGKKHTEEHKQKISESVKAYHGERKQDGNC